MKPPPPPLDRCLQMGSPPGPINRLRFSQNQQPHPQGRTRIEKTDPEEIIMPVVNHRQLSQLTLPVLLQDAIRIEPGMPRTELPFRRWGDPQMKAGSRIFR